jgi:hypothetical protein
VKVESKLSHKALLPCGLSNPQQKVELNIGWQWRHLSVVGESDFSGKSMETKR